MNTDKQLEENVKSATSQEEKQSNSSYSKIEAFGLKLTKEEKEAYIDTFERNGFDVEETNEGKFIVTYKTQQVSAIQFETEEQAIRYAISKPWEIIMTMVMGMAGWLHGQVASGKITVNELKEEV